MHRMWTAGWAVPLLALLLLTATSASKLNQSWLVPGERVHIDNAILKSATGKICALTFDDGPDKKYTSQICEILDQYQVKATFFIIGQNVQAHPAVLQQLINSGHEIGNHSYSHPDFTRLSASALRKQLEQTNTALAKYSATPRWFRPPYGAFNSTSIKAAAALGMNTVLWSVDTRDWTTPGAERIKERVLAGVIPGAVVLLHSTNAQTVAALPAIIEGLQDKGYTLVTMSQWQAVLSGIGREGAQVLSSTPLNTEKRLQQLPQHAELVVPTADDISAANGRRLGQSSSSILESEAVAAGTADAASAGAQPAFTAAGSPLTSAVEHAEPLKVFCNFLGTRELVRVLDTAYAGELYMLEQQPRMPVSDTQLIAAEPLPTLPEGEELILPELALGGTSVVEQPLPVSSLPDTAAGAMLKQMQSQVKADLLNASDPAARWLPAEEIDTSSFLNRPGSSQSAETGQCSAYLLCQLPDVSAETWAGLTTFARLAKLEGLVFPFGYSAPDKSWLAEFPTARQYPELIDRHAQIELSAELIADALSLLKQGKRSVFLTVRANNTQQFCAVQSWTEFGAELKDFILLRQMTSGLKLNSETSAITAWDLSQGLEVSCFSGGGKTCFALYNSTHQPLEIAVPQELKQIQLAQLDDSGKLLLTPVSAVTFEAKPGLTLLYLDSAQS